jgi:beta-N-acetylhexosaminidase
VGIGALLQVANALATAPPPAPPPAPPDDLAGLSARQKAALVVVSGLPAPAGVAGVLVRRWDRTDPRPRGALVFVDQEGSGVKAFPELPPGEAASGYGSPTEAAAAGRATGRALAAAGVDVDLAPVLDLRSGPLGSRHFSEPALGLAFARGLEAGGVAACPKHFPGLGSAPISTDDDQLVPARVLSAEVRAFRRAIADGARCVMVSHAAYDRFGGRRGVTSPELYRFLRGLGFEGVAITDSLGIVSGKWPVKWARQAAQAGADLLLFTSGDDARRAIAALVPLARRGLLDDAVLRVIGFRESLGLGPR